MVDDKMPDEEKNEKYMAIGRERTLKMMQKADEKNPAGPSLVGVWNKLPSNLKYQISNVIMGVIADPNA